VRRVLHNEGLLYDLAVPQRVKNFSVLCVIIFMQFYPDPSNSVLLGPNYSTGRLYPKRSVCVNFFYIGKIRFHVNAKQHTGLHYCVFEYLCFQGANRKTKNSVRMISGIP